MPAICAISFPCTGWLAELATQKRRVAPIV
jgi:hypothetical protein